MLHYDISSGSHVYIIKFNTWSRKKPGENVTPKMKDYFFVVVPVPGFNAVIDSDP